MKIKADSSRMKIIGDHIMNDASEFADRTKELENQLDEIINDWQGADATRYITLLKENYVSHLDEFAKIIHAYGLYIKDAANIYALLEGGVLEHYNGGHTE